MNAALERLSYNGLNVDVLPEAGARISAFWSQAGGKRHDWFTPAPSDWASSSWGSFPLVPFSNRIRDGRFSWQGREHRIAVSEQHAPHAIHGHGRGRPWTIERRTEHAIELSYIHAGGDWPFAYKAHQRISIEDDALVIDMGLENIGQEIMPGGLGHHPYIPWREGPVLETSFGSVWPAKDGVLPSGPAAVPVDLNFSSGRLVPRGLDTGFGGWSGQARIAWHREGLALDVECSSALGHVIIFTPAGADFFCFEPVTHAIDALNLAACGVPETGQIALVPGERLAVSMRFLPRVTAS
jgi:aldose 1-epimerase